MNFRNNLIFKLIFLHQDLTITHVCYFLCPQVFENSYIFFFRGHLGASTLLTMYEFRIYLSVETLMSLTHC